MNTKEEIKEQRYKLSLQDVQKLLQALEKEGYTVISPKVKNGALTLSELSKGESPPLGYSDIQSPGKYKLQENDDNTLFSYTVPMQSWRRFLNTEKEVLFKTKINSKGFTVEPGENSTSTPAQKKVFFGIRVCDLKGVEIQDRIFINNTFEDPYYKARRENVFIIAADCLSPAETCFCTSMNSGPEHTQGFDIALAELEPNVIIARGTKEATQKYLKDFPKADEAIIEKNLQKVKEAKEAITRTINLEDAKKALATDLDHPHWDIIADKCLSCSNCTFVCPTCFCTSIDESPAIDGKSSERIRRWDSCFNISHSYIHGGHIRSSVKSRYRQWLTHKLINWESQFDASGCTGCGRCITWCPSAIDFTQEIAKFAETEGQNAHS